MVIAKKSAIDEKDESVVPQERAAQRRAHWAGIVLVACAAILYAFTLDNGLAVSELHGGDLITHQYAQVQGRPGNAPGYPIYTMGGWLWFHGVRTLVQAIGNPLPNPIPILSAYSTIWALLALWLLYEIVRFVTSTRYRPTSRHGRAGNLLLAWLLAAFYAVTYFFWYYATTTEQYSSAVAQTLTIVLLYLLWSEADQRAAQGDATAQRRADRLLIGAAFLCGVSLAHMLTVAFIVPPLVGVILWQRPTLLRRGWLVLACIVIALLPLTAYLYVYLRGAAHPEWWGSMYYANANEWFWSFVRTSQGFDELRWGTREGRPFFGGGFPELIWQELSIPLLALGTVGIALLRRRTAAMLYGTIAIYLLFCWAYRYGNWYQVIMPVYALLLLGVAAIFERFIAIEPISRAKWLRAIAYFGLVSAILWRTNASLPQANSRNRIDDMALNHPALMAATAIENAAIFGVVDERLGIQYLVDIWGMRPDLTIADSDKAADAAKIRPLLSTWEAAPTLLAEIEGEGWRVEGISPDWVRLTQEADDPVLPKPGTELLPGALGVTLESAALAPDGSPVWDAPHALDVLLRWSLPQGVWPANTSVSVRPTVGGTHVEISEGAISQHDLAAPLRGMGDKSLAPNAPVDAFRLPIGESLPDGLRLIVYQTDSGEALEVVDLPLPPLE